MTERAYSIWHPVLSNTIPISFIRKNELFIDDDGQMARFSQIKTANVTRHPPQQSIEIRGHKEPYVTSRTSRYHYLLPSQ